MERNQSGQKEVASHNRNSISKCDYESLPRGRKARFLAAPVHRKAAPGGAAKSNNAQCTNCRASATSTESPSWFSTSSPDSGTSPDVLCDTMIFLAISPRQVICEELA